MAQLLAFVRLSRPLFLYGGFAGVALGAAVARWTGRPLDVASYAWAQALVTAFQLMVHYANDYFDRECDAGARRTPFSGGSGILLGGGIAPRTALLAAVICAAVGLAVCVRFALAGNVATAAIGAAIAVLAWCYSAPPVRFAARGLGEADTALVVAILVPCASYAAFTRRIDETILAVVVAPAFAMIAMMLSVELPDADSDMLAGKRNLVVRFGTSRTWWLLAGLAPAAVAIAVACAVTVHGSVATVALAPAAMCALGLMRVARGDWRPSVPAFWGVALYATTVTGLAAIYAFL